MRWGTKAIELARELGDRQAEVHALNNVGTALATGGDVLEGHTKLTQSLDLALAEDAHEHAARAFTNLGSTGVVNRSLAEADRHLRAGIIYCADRDLDTWRLYMTAWLARSLAEQGQYAAAEQHLADVTRHPHVTPITQVSLLPVAGVLAARRGLDGTEALDLFMDTHTMDGPVSLDDVAKAHAADLQTQDGYGVHYLRYWVDQEHGKIFCLVDAPDAGTAATVHREAHGLVADEIYPVAEGA